jgi:2-polyprenyl-3-methyl-5-hydroxy-6-metoxy-1,4-benzoquinol methylase
MIVHPLHFSYASGEVNDGHDKRGVVSNSRLEFLTSLIVRLTRHRRPTEPIRILDLGCGTGRFAIPLAHARPNFEVTGLDRSAQVLGKACVKPQANRVKWVLADAAKLPFEGASFDAIFMSDVFHHFERPELVIRQCFRLLSGRGWLINKFGAIDHIVHDPEHVFFPGAIDIDRKRTPNKRQMESNMANGGFREMQTETRTERTRISGNERLEAAKAKAISVLHLLSDEDYATGLERLAEYAERHPHSGWLMVDQITYTCGRKPG